jgi:hypothetical protein
MQVVLMFQEFIVLLIGWLRVEKPPGGWQLGDGDGFGGKAGQRDTVRCGLGDERRAGG